MSVINSDPLWDTEESAAYINSNPRTMANWRAAGEGPDYVKVGRLVRYPKSSLDRYKKQREVRLGGNAA